MKTIAVVLVGATAAIRLLTMLNNASASPADIRGDWTWEDGEANRPLIKIRLRLEADGSVRRETRTRMLNDVKVTETRGRYEIVDGSSGKPEIRIRWNDGSAAETWTVEKAGPNALEMLSPAGEPVRYRRFSAGAASLPKLG